MKPKMLPRAMSPQSVGQAMAQDVRQTVRALNIDPHNFHKAQPADVPLIELMGRAMRKIEDSAGRVSPVVYFAPGHPFHCVAQMLSDHAEGKPVRLEDVIAEVNRLDEKHPKNLTMAECVAAERAVYAGGMKPPKAP